MRRHRRKAHLPVVLAVGAATLVLGFAFQMAPGKLAPESELPAGQTLFDTHFNAGVRHLQAKQPAQAIDAFSHAHRFRPEVPEVHVNLGYAHLALKQYSAAELSFRTAVDMRRHQVNAYYGWAESLEGLGDLDRAIGAMQTYLHLTPKEDPFRTKAMAAVWEWQSELDRRKSPKNTEHGAAGVTAVQPGADTARESPSGLGHREDEP